MKHPILAVCALATGLFWGCDSSSSTGPGGGTAAPLDSIALSKEVRDTMNGAPVSYRLAVQKDSSYAVDLNLIMDFNFFQTPGYTPLLRLSVLAADKDSTIVTMDGTSQNFNPEVRFTAHATGYLRVRVGGAGSEGVSPYRLRIEPMDRYEPDDIVSRAVAVAVDSTYTYRTMVDALSDVDWIKFRTIPGSVYEMMLTDPRLQTEIVRFDKSTTLTSQKSGDGLVLRFLALDTLTYASFRNSSTSTIFDSDPLKTNFAYGVALVEKSGDAFEPDNTLKIASPLTATGGVQLRTASLKDDDYVRLAVGAGRTYKILFQPDVALLVDVLSADSLLLNQWEIPASSSNVTKILEARTADAPVLRIRPKSSMPGYYRLTLSEIASDPYEPDLQLSKAAALLEGSLGGRYLSAGDVDWFSLAADSGKTYTISHPTSELGSVAATLWASDSTPVSGQNFRRLADASFVFVCRKSGKYFYAATVADSSNEVRAYTIALAISTDIPAWFVVADAFEPDDNLATASKLMADSSLVSHSMLVGDVDWSRIAVDSGRTYFVEISNTGLNPLAFALFTADSVRLDTVSTVPAAKTAKRLYTARKAGALLVRVGATDSASKYTVRIWAAPVDSSEPDNDISQARAMVVGAKALVRNLDGNPDWFQVRLDSTQRYLFDLARQDNGGCGVQMALYGPDSNTVLASLSSPAAAFELAYAAPTSGDYHLKAWASGCPDRAIPYTLLAKLDPEDVYEADNTLAGAKTIPTDSTVQTRTVSTGNDDLIRIDIDSGTTYVIEAGTGTSGERIFVGLLAADSSLTNSDNSVNSLRITTSSSRRTTYYLRIRSASNQPVPFPYTVSVKATAPAKPVKLIEGPIVLEEDGIAKPVAFRMGDSMVVVVSGKRMTNYVLQFRSDVGLRYSMYQDGFDGSQLDGTIGTSSSSMQIKWQQSSAGIYRIVLKGPKGRLVKFEAILTAN